tara:strand:+ start:54 stop:929 length:876 start_codon:yes stop_codon:yes gene_type:complete
VEIMIDLKRNAKGELVPATGLNSQSWRIYKPNQEKDFPISRSRFEDFKKCPRCFYLRLVRGFQEPDIPKFKLNELTDTLLKKEFDKCRKNQEPHRKLKEEGLEHIVPYDAGTIILTNSRKEKKKWEVIDVWRDSINHGLKRRFQKTKIILQGGIDDVWFNTKTKELIVVDYKSQANPKEVSQDTYFEKGYRESYKTQLDFYAYLMQGMDDLKYEISSDSYLYVVNGLDVEEGFNAKIKFSETLIHHEIKTDYLDDEIQNMIDTINSTNVPQGNESCKNCAYARQRSKTDTL